MRVPPFPFLAALALSALPFAACRAADAPAAPKAGAAAPKPEAKESATQHPDARPKAAATEPEPDTSSKDFVPMFNGTDLSGWKRVNGSAKYVWKDGEVVGTDNHSGPNTFLRTEREDYKDFVLAFDFKWVIESNSGMQFRSAQVQPGDTGKYWSKTADGRVYGYQCEIDPSGRAWTCGIMEEGRRGWLQSVSGPLRVDARASYKAHEWNRVVIKAKGTRLQTWLNGVPVSDHVDDAPEARSQGFFGLQVHGGRSGEIHWRNVRILELK